MDSSSSSAFGSGGDPVLLHGDLDLHIIEAKNLPNMDMFIERFHRCFAFCGLPFLQPPTDEDGHLPNSRGFPDTDPHPHARKIVTSDPYVKVIVAGATVAHTRVVRNSQNPFWDDRFKIPLAHCAPWIEFRMKDSDVFSAQFMGKATVSARQVASGEPYEAWLPILASGRPLNPDCMLHVSLRFVPVEGNPVYRHGIAGDPEKLGVRDTYFPVRKGGRVTLYQDAHIRKEDHLQQIELDDGRVFENEKCWEDMCHAILEARHLIYVVGWSIHDKVKLVREPTRPLPKAGELSLGELLKHKSQDGVRVCLLVWDDKTSHDKFFLRTGGVMQTEDEKIRKYFKHSSVICVLSPRTASSKLSMIKQQVVGSIYTHHQKCLLVDTKASNYRRKITAFIGGLDLCRGRYDTPEHRLFRDLDSIFRDDVYNPTFTTKTKGPRQPWHDLHCKIEGPAAYDVLLNFEQRWQKATTSKLFGRFMKVHRYEDALLKIDRILWMLSPSATDLYGDPNLWVSAEEDSENWHVQIFRSIDSGSVKGFPKFVQQAESESSVLPKLSNLVCEKNLVIDKSIHTAYIEAIRSAQHFIYIENQYFLGSSYDWPSYQTAVADNLVPMELALKIASKIRARERFAVYIVIPMWPEGAPTSNSVQEILFWQGQTIKMMYKIIANELKSNNYENSQPQDYLNFYCLGTREPANSSYQSASQLSNEEVSSQRSRRFMIYVHAKGMIVDDEYVILGSANINQRSLDGSRDTEIAMGAYQPHHTWAARMTHPCGQVYGYRMSLWAEHLGEVNEKIKQPHSLDCVQYVNSIAEDNWLRYTAEERVRLKGHLLKYPVKVYNDGRVEALPGHESFPDVGGKVLGEPTAAIPDQVTM